MTHEALLAALQALAQIRPAFHSEADFQHELAWLLRERKIAEQIRLERPFDVGGDRLNLDVLAICGGEPVGLELKYWKRGARFRHGNEPYTFKNQAAQDISRYDFWKDVVRLQTLVNAGYLKRGYAVALTNDPSYWNKSERVTVDADFRLHHEREARGTLRWAPGAGPGTRRGRELDLALTGAYQIQWTGYSALAGQTFRAVVVAVGSG